jgi:anti-anti-sigma regulatory factor
MPGLAQGWNLDAETAGEWLCLRVVQGGSDMPTEPPVAEAIWSLLREHGKVRLIVELDASLPLASLLVGQIVMLHKRAHLSGGTLRLCGLSADQEHVLRLMGLAERLPNYASRAAALAGDRPSKPR